MFPRPPHSDSSFADAGEDLDELLTDPHCRYLLAFLRQHEGPRAVDTVSRYIVGELTDTAPSAVPENVQRRVATWLHHGQLPALADHGIVDFDPEQRTVALAGDPSVGSTGVVSGESDTLCDEPR